MVILSFFPSIFAWLILCLDFSLCFFNIEVDVLIEYVCFLQMVHWNFSNPFSSCILMISFHILSWISWSLAGVFFSHNLTYRIGWVDFGVHLITISSIHNSRYILNFLNFLIKFIVFFEGSFCFPSISIHFVFLIFEDKKFWNKL